MVVVTAVVVITRVSPDGRPPPTPGGGVQPWTVELWQTDVHHASDLYEDQRQPSTSEVHVQVSSLSLTKHRQVSSNVLSNDWHIQFQLQQITCQHSPAKPQKMLLVILTSFCRLTPAKSTASAILLAGVGCRSSLLADKLTNTDGPSGITLSTRSVAL